MNWWIAGYLALGVGSAVWVYQQEEWLRACRMVESALEPLIGATAARLLVASGGVTVTLAWWFYLPLVADTVRCERRRKR